MEIRNIITFIKVAEVQSFSKAAEQLGYSQAAVTIQIKQLEGELGSQLFDRISKTIRLTSDGEKFFPYAAEILRLSEMAKSFNKEQNGPSGRLRISTNSSIVDELLPAFLVRFNEYYPNVDVVVRNTEGLIYDKLRQNETDIAIFLEKKVTNKDCVIFSEREEPVVFVANPQSSAAKLAGGTSLKTLFTNPFISTNRDNSYELYLEQELAPSGISIDPKCEIASTDAVVSMLTMMDAFSFLPYFTVEKYVKRGDLVVINTEPVDVQVFTQIGYHKNKWVNPQMKAFMKFMVSGDVVGLPNGFVQTGDAEL